MAVIDNDGAVRGTVGKYVYRKVNGKGVVQAHLGPLEPKGGTILENRKFGGASEVTAVIYPYIKEFGLNMCYSYAYGRLLNCFKKVLYTYLVGKNKGEYVALDEVNSLSKIFSELPFAEKAEKLITVKIPEIKLRKNDSRFLNAEFMDYQLELLLLDYDTNIVDTIFHYTTERFNLNEGLDANDVLIDLSIPGKRLYTEGEAQKELELLLGKSLLVLCFRTQFFAHKNSLHSLNTKKFNPAAVLGAWHLGRKWE